ncbi:MAG: OmpA family protein [Desulfuromusa sp.]|nr:OmpA family protein [Desulfuromusa sp.]
MNRSSIAVLMVFFLTVISFVPTGANALELVTTTETVVVDDVEIEIVKTADNFIVFYDSSGSMGEVYKDTGKKKIDLEKAIFKIRNAILPDLEFNAGLYTFAPQSISLSTKTLKPYYEMQPYNKAKFDQAIDQLPTEAKGATLLQQGLSELDSILAGLKGHTVVFVVTDGTYTDRSNRVKKQELFEEDEHSPVGIAKALAKKYKVSFFVINSSSEQKESKVLNAVASISENSRVITFDQFINSPLAFSGALFVLNEKLVQRSINIEKIIGAKLKKLLFAFDQTGINKNYTDGMKLLGEYLQSTPKARLAIAGFTDSTGTSEYNLGLSHRRTVSAADYLVEKFNISADRITQVWYGEANPVASNATAEGRAQNRRVEGFIFWTE